VVVFLNRDVTIQPEVKDRESAVRTSNDVPASIGRTKYRDVVMSVAIEITDSRLVSVQAPLDESDGFIPTVFDVPHAVRWAEDGKVRLPVAVVIGRGWYVPGKSPLDRQWVSHHTRTLPGDVPRPVRWTEECVVRNYRADVIFRYRDVIRLTENLDA